MTPKSHRPQSDRIVPAAPIAPTPCTPALPCHHAGSRFAAGACAGLAALLLAACSGSPQNQADAANAAVNGAAVETIEDPDAMVAGSNDSASPLPTDAWVGRWAGPEGLFLDIQAASDGKPGHYILANKDNLDRQADYQGVADGSTIRFVREGRDLTVRPGNGDATGFKYLAGKQDCLIVIPDQEGYCR